MCIDYMSEVSTINISLETQKGPYIDRFTRDFTSLAITMPKPDYIKKSVRV